MSQRYEAESESQAARNVVPLKAVSPGVERAGRALLHWVNAPEVRPLFYASSMTAPVDAEAFWAMWESRRDGAGIQPVGLGGTVDPLPGELAGAEAMIRASEQFRTVYEPLGAQFASVTIENLVTPQWWVDTDHVDELLEQVPAENDLEGLFAFCFAPGSVGQPLMLGMNGVGSRAESGA